MTAFDRAALTSQLQVGTQALELELSAAQIAKLIDYLTLLVKWNAVYNLTAVRDPAQMVTQHLLDSLAVVPALRKVSRVLDVGAGGGLPGMAIAIWAAEKHPEMSVSMIDTVHKKTAFLTQVKAELGLTNVTVYTARVEQLQVIEKFDMVISRAFAELKDFVNWSGHLLAEGGQFIAMKGMVPQQEMNGLPPAWQVREVRPLAVPGLKAERHLIFIERSGSDTETAARSVQMQVDMK
jgi:16S rRNA (guanine527-N7)-methyltransferase